jgi:ribonuclease HI
MEADYTITFDGGTRGANPGRGYGSFEIKTAAGRQLLEGPIDFVSAMTNNQAEYEALVRALQKLDEIMMIAGHNPADTTIAVFGDSELVIKQLKGEYQVKHMRMKILHAKCQSLTMKFRQVNYAWHSRDNSVRLFGH